MGTCSKVIVVSNYAESALVDKECIFLCLSTIFNNMYTPEYISKVYNNPSSVQPETSFFSSFGEDEAKRRQKQQEYKEEVQKDMEERSIHHSKLRKSIGKEEPSQPAYENRQFRPPSFQESDPTQQPDPFTLKFVPKEQRSYSPAKPSIKPQAEPPEEYFPFGRPGAGAPYRDEQGQVIASRSTKYTYYNNIVVGTDENIIARPVASGPYVQDPNKQRQYFRETLDKQVAERNHRRKEEEKLRMDRDLEDERKLRRDREELNRRELNELQFDKARQPHTRPLVDNSPPRQKLPIPAATKPQFAREPAILPTKPEVVAPQFSLSPAPMPAKAEVSTQEAALKDMLNLLKQEAATSEMERNAVFNELSKLKEDISLHSVPRYRYISSVQSPGLSSFGLKRVPSPPSRTLYGESTFLPLSSAGQSIIRSTPPPQRRYHVSDPSARDQLARLDKLLQEFS